jgi:hypothetical protein
VVGSAQGAQDMQGGQPWGTEEWPGSKEAISKPLPRAPAHLALVQEGWCPPDGWLPPPPPAWRSGCGTSEGCRRGQRLPASTGKQGRAPPAWAAAGHASAPGWAPRNQRCV